MAGLHPDDRTLADALLRHWGETDPAIMAEWLAGLSADPERLAQMYNQAIKAGLATWEPAPNNPVTKTPEAPRPTASCARCGHFERDPINPIAGIGRCLTDAPASHERGSLWPRGEIRCNDFREASR